MLMETFNDIPGNPSRKVADSLLYLGRKGYGTKKRLPYSCVRVDVQDGCPPKFIVRGLVAERIGEEWRNRQVKPFVI